MDRQVTIRLCLIQSSPEDGVDNLKLLYSAIQQGCADIYALPELFTVGMARLGQCDPDGYAEVAYQHDCVVQLISNAIQGSNSVVVCGLLERRVAVYYNTATVILGNPAISRYRQKDPARTATIPRLLNVLAGEFSTATLWAWCCIGLMVCHDHWGTEEFFKEYKARGAQAILLIADSASPTSVREKFSKCCKEHGLPAIICNSAGPGKGGSCIIDREGNLMPLRTATNAAVEYLSQEPSIAIGDLTVTRPPARIMTVLAAPL